MTHHNANHEELEEYHERLRLREALKLRVELQELLTQGNTPSSSVHEAVMKNQKEANHQEDDDDDSEDYEEYDATYVISPEGDHSYDRYIDYRQIANYESH